MKSKILFVLGLGFCLTPWASPPLALLAGLFFGAIASHPYPGESRQVSKYLLQAAVVGLGFGMNLHQVLRAGRGGFLYTAVGIGFALMVGSSIGKLVAVHPRASFLISTGTAICGGSAIAAVGPVISATEDEMSVSLGTIFLLNSVALLTFPAIGTALKMSQSQFGLWTALAIHDTSSVVGACAKYGAVALAVGTTVKLARALWIVPVTVVTAVTKGSKTRIQWPWFILFFCLAAMANTYLLAGLPVYHFLSNMGKLMLIFTLFLIGATLSPAALRKVGPRPLIQGVLLWIVVGVASLLAIRAGWISL
ncbi:MAG TPA: putative sulfate exporter family transporter [Candidatus Eisenbacteria bacterium]|nr:putative sulfate exporter family transporter [Candidatus Eisenbacteria bacterium]